MRIGVEASSYYKNIAGTGVYIRSIIEILLRKKENKEIILFSNGRQSGLDLAKKRNMFKRLFNALKDIIWVQIGLPYNLIKNNIDILFCPAYIAPVLSPRPTVVTIHDASFLRYPNTCDKLFRLYLKILLPFIKRRVDVILTDSFFSKDEIIALLKVPPERVQVVYCGCSKNFIVINDMIAIDNIRTKYNLPKNFILHVGTLEPRKNITALVLAFNLLKKKELIEHKLIICGSRGWYYDGIYNKVRELKLEKEVVFTGYIPDDDLPFLYNMADVFVFPSLYEGFGLPVLEAMACGCSVVTSSVSSLPEVVGNAGILVDPLNIDEMAEGILRIINDKSLKEDLIRKGIERVKMFSWENTAKQILDIFEETLDKQ
jgi:glycosyltransferase involved in cell wall biosynthesis